MRFVTAADATRIFCKDGVPNTAQPIVFSHDLRSAFSTKRLLKEKVSVARSAIGPERQFSRLQQFFRLLGDKADSLKSLVKSTLMTRAAAKA